MRLYCFFSWLLNLFILLIQVIFRPEISNNDPVCKEIKCVENKSTSTYYIDDVECNETKYKCPLYEENRSKHLPFIKDFTFQEFVRIMESKSEELIVKMAKFAVVGFPRLQEKLE